MPNLGDIIHYKEYEFEDGNKANKLFVVLHNEPCLVLKTTSRPRRYNGAKQGCNEDLKVFFAPVSWQSCFNIDTYIQLPQIFEFSIHELLSGGALGSGNIEILDSALSDDCLPQLKNCLKKFKDDISQNHWKLISW